jgi:hypothetical protein
MASSIVSACTTVKTGPKISVLEDGDKHSRITIGSFTHS